MNCSILCPQRGAPTSAARSRANVVARATTEAAKDPAAKDLPTGATLLAITANHNSEARGAWT